MSTWIRTACIECDLIVTVRALEGGEQASCPRCHHVLTANVEDAQTKCLALALDASMLLVMSNVFPFMSLEASGLEQVMTLPGSALQLYRDGFATIAVLVLGPIVGIPALILGVAMALLIALRQERGASWLVPAGRLLFFLNPWSMVEVFVIAVLVSLVKIGAMATVILGISFWAYVAFAVCFTAMLVNLDRVQLWRAIEARVA